MLLRALSVLAFLLTIYFGNEFTNQIQRTEQLREITESTRDLLISLLNAETGQRGYLITNDSRYLAPYTSGVQTATQRLATLERLIHGHAQAHEAEDIHTLVGQKLDELLATIRLHEADQKAAVDEVKGHLGKNLMDQLRIHLDTVETTADMSLMVTQERATFYARSSFLAGCLALIMAIISIMAHLRR